MSFYEDREERDVKEDVGVREERKNVFISESIRFQTFFLCTQAFFYIIYLDLLHATYDG